MRIIKDIIILAIFLLLLECILFCSSNVPGWYKKDYVDSEYIYGKGRGQSQREALALKKAETAAQSELSARADIVLKQIMAHVMQSDGVLKTDAGANRYYQAGKRTILKIKTLAKTEKREIKHNGSLFSAFILLQVSKANLEELYLNTLHGNTIK